MASVISTSASGLDIPTVVSTLVSRQKDPEQARINKAGTAATTQLSAISQIKSSMTTLKSALDKVISSADTNAYKATVPTDAGFTATTTSWRRRATIRWKWSRWRPRRNWPPVHSLPMPPWVAAR